MQTFHTNLGQVYAHVNFYEDKKMVVLDWHGDFLTLEEIVAVGEYELEGCEKLGIKKIINDNSDLSSTWDHALDWNINYWLPKALAIGINRLAMIVSTNIFEKMSGEEIKQNFEGKLETRFFDNYPDAEKWILNS